MRNLQNEVIVAKSKNKPWTEEKLINRIGIVENDLRGRLMDMKDPMKLQYNDRLKPTDPYPDRKTF